MGYDARQRGHTRGEPREASIFLPAEHVLWRSKEGRPRKSRQAPRAEETKPGAEGTTVWVAGSLDRLGMTRSDRQPTDLS